MLVYLAILKLILAVTLAEEKTWTVTIDQGEVRGYKYWNGDYYEFYGIPYASVPTGRDRFKSPLPPKQWNETFEATEDHKYIMCPQLVHIEAEPIDDMVIGDEECLVINIFIPTKAEHSDNPLPVVVYIHGGAYSLGYGNMGSFNNLLNQDVVVASFNYRIGALGFLCLGTEEIPGNAGLRDQIEALKWVKRNIGKFKGNPDDVTIAGFTVGASSVELLMISEAADGLFNKVIADSGSALSPWAVDIDPFGTAKNIAKRLGFDSEDTKELADFYLAASAKSLASKSLHIWHPNSTFSFAPCVEKKIKNTESILTESPFELLKQGRYKKLPILMGYSNMEGISRLGLFVDWSERMNDDFNEFLPADLSITRDDEIEVVNKIKEVYFNNEVITEDNVQGYIDYFSDTMFLHSILRSAKLHRRFSDVYLYEFSYVGRLSAQHQFMANITGASHRDQTAYYLNFGLAYTSKPEDLKTRSRMSTMWSNFIMYGKPIPETSDLLDVEWLSYSEDSAHYMSIGEDLKLLSTPLEERFNLWSEIYERFYREPRAPEKIDIRTKTEL